MQKFKIEIIETLSKIVEVEAEDFSEAKDIVRERYFADEVDYDYVLDNDDYVFTEFKPCAE